MPARALREPNPFTQLLPAATEPAEVVGFVSLSHSQVDAALQGWRRWGNIENLIAHALSDCEDAGRPGYEVDVDADGFGGDNYAEVAWNHVASWLLNEGVNPLDFEETIGFMIEQDQAEASDTMREPDDFDVVELRDVIASRQRRDVLLVGFGQIDPMPSAPAPQVIARPHVVAHARQRESRGSAPRRRGSRRCTPARSSPSDDPSDPEPPSRRCPRLDQVAALPLPEGVR
jgi:hypothetical protein